MGREDLLFSARFCFGRALTRYFSAIQTFLKLGVAPLKRSMLYYSSRKGAAATQQPSKQVGVAELADALA